MQLQQILSNISIGRILPKKTYNVGTGSAYFALSYCTGISSELHRLEATSTHLLRPYTVLARTQDSLRIKRSLDLLVEFHLRVVVEAVCVGNLIHDSKVGSILAPASLRCVVDQRCNEPVRAATGVWVLAIETAAC